MARVTVEDCLRNVDNRFDLVLKASERARLLERGATAKVPWENDKPTVVALREIAKGVFVEKPEEETVEVFAEEEIQPVSQITLAEAEAELVAEEVLEEGLEVAEAQESEPALEPAVESVEETQTEEEV